MKKTILGLIIIVGAIGAASVFVMIVFHRQVDASHGSPINVTSNIASYPTAPVNLRVHNGGPGINWKRCDFLNGNARHTTGPTSWGSLSGSPGTGSFGISAGQDAVDVQTNFGGYNCLGNMEHRGSHNLVLPNNSTSTPNPADYSNYNYRSTSILQYYAWNVLGGGNYEIRVWRGSTEITSHGLSISNLSSSRPLVRFNDALSNSQFYVPPQSTGAYTIRGLNQLAQIHGAGDYLIRVSVEARPVLRHNNGHRQCAASPFQDANPQTDAGNNCNTVHPRAEIQVTITNAQLNIRHSGLPAGNRNFTISHHSAGICGWGTITGEGTGSLSVPSGSTGLRCGSGAGLGIGWHQHGTSRWGLELTAPTAPSGYRFVRWDVSSGALRNNVVAGNRSTSTGGERGGHCSTAPSAGARTICVNMRPTNPTNGATITAVYEQARGNINVQRVIHGSTTLTPSGNGTVSLSSESNSTNNPHTWSNITVGTRTLSASGSFNVGDATYERTGYRDCGTSACNSTTHRNPSNTGNNISVSVPQDQTRYTRAYYTIDRPPVITFTATCTTISGTVTDPDHAGPFSGTIRVRRSGSDHTDISFTTDASGNFTRDYPGVRQTDQSHTVRVTATGKKSDGSNGKSTTTDWSTVAACYAANCSILDVQPAVVIAQEEYNIRANSENTGGLAWNATNRVRAIFSVNHGSAPSATGDITLARNTTTSPTPTYGVFTAGSTLNQHTPSMQLQYRNSAGSWTNISGANCNRSFDPWTNFTLTPSHRDRLLSPTDENPSEFRYRSRVRASYDPVNGPDVPSNNSLRTTRQIFHVRGATENQVWSNNTYIGAYTTSSPDFTDTYTIPAGQFQAGDDYCGRIGVSNNQGLINRHAAVRDLNSSAQTDMLCSRVVDRPYVSAFGADVIAGHGFGESCSQEGIINTFFDSSNNRGSGAQFAALAMTQIEQFASAKMRTSNPTPRAGLSFANSGPGVGAYGGSYPRRHCTTDYFSQMPAEVSEINGPGQFNSALSGSGGKFNYLLTGDRRASTGSNSVNSNGRQVTVYVDGDFIINRNITFQNSASWTDVDRIPSLNIIVRGNIYITNAVTQLDGTYIAQPDADGNGGIIYTCSTSDGSPRTANQIFGNCTNPLTVNGSFIAQTIKLNRYAQSSLRFGNQAEFPYGSSRTCESGATRSVCAAEIFNFSPETYLTQPALPPTSTPGQSRYDSITSLPPIL